MSVEIPQKEASQHLFIILIIMILIQHLCPTGEGDIAFVGTIRQGGWGMKTIILAEAFCKVSVLQCAK